jgi:hypothetical protein
MVVGGDSPECGLFDLLAKRLAVESQEFSRAVGVTMTIIIVIAMVVVVVMMKICSSSSSSSSTSTIVVVDDREPPAIFTLPGQARHLEGVVVALPATPHGPKIRLDPPGARPTNLQGSQQLHLGNCPWSVCWDRAHRAHSKRLDGPRRRAGRQREPGRERRWRVLRPSLRRGQQLRQLRRRALFQCTRELPSRPSSDGLTPQGGRQSWT